MPITFKLNSFWQLFTNGMIGEINILEQICKIVYNNGFGKEKVTI